MNKTTLFWKQFDEFCKGVKPYECAMAQKAAFIEGVFAAAAALDELKSVENMKPYLFDAAAAKESYSEVPTDREKKKEEFWINTQGQQVHTDNIPASEYYKTIMIGDLIAAAKVRRDDLQAFKQFAYDEAEEYMRLQREKYKIADDRSTEKNLTLTSFDGKMQVQFNLQHSIRFDEKLTLAKAKIDEYLKEKTEHADSDIRTLITNVFEVDKQGAVDAKKILSLKRYEISHPLWVEAMAIIDDAVEIASSKSYVNFKERGDDGKYKSITLDIAKV